jgi:hypothetical protein
MSGSIVEPLLSPKSESLLRRMIRETKQNDMFGGLMRAHTPGGIDEHAANFPFDQFAVDRTDALACANAKNRVEQVDYRNIQPVQPDDGIVT